MTWQPTRQAALERLRAFLPQAGRAYAANRNFDLGPQDRTNVSGLSPYIRHRLILEEEVLSATLQRHSLSTAAKFVQEVFWRTYFKGWLEQRPLVWTRYRTELEALVQRLEKDDSLRERYTQAVEGETGIQCFDSWATELHRTGYLHNHARMWFASIWIFTLELPWQLGADFLYRHLLDGDPASNTLGWRWVGGLHTQGKTYLARASNIARYTHSRFNPQGQLAAEAPALIESTLDAPTPLPSVDFAAPRDQRIGLLVTEEDTCSETLTVPAPPVTAIGLTATAARSPLRVAPLATAFAEGAVTDALARVGQRLEIETTQPSSADWGQTLVRWARRHRLGAVLTAYAPVGPVAEHLRAARRELKNVGIGLIEVERPYDAVAWPHASKGFFGLRTKIPAILSELSIGKSTPGRG